MGLYVRLADDTSASPERWPTVTFTLDTLIDFMIPPVSWQFFIDEIRDYLVTQLGMADGSGLDTALRVQHALLPAREREFPYSLSLAHDYAAWHRTMVDMKRRSFEVDWCPEVPRLESFGPGTLDVDDPQSVATLGLGMSMFYDTDSDWELGSEVARPMRFRHSINA